ncbi:ankyrin [Hesseltinella vesiculosa]|uniref:Ankyrin n=1 Tax=Hesseltinella vesiculosa TaxID=101127 RepID=A0A1X2GUE7_9FUNG|nr:ankyrin [Hesseltinella vesiculosa]
MSQEVIEDIIYCARYGEFDDLKQSNSPPDYYVAKDESGNTALHMASANNHLDIVLFILEALSKLQDKSHVNVKNDLGNTPLHWAALNGHLEVVKALIKNEAGKTPIYEAQQRNFETIAEFFLDTMIEEEQQKEEMDEDEQFVETGVPKDDAMEE